MWNKLNLKSYLNFVILMSIMALWIVPAFAAGEADKTYGNMAVEKKHPGKAIEMKKNEAAENSKKEYDKTHKKTQTTPKKTGNYTHR